MFKIKMYVLAALAMVSGLFAESAMATGTDPISVALAAVDLTAVAASIAVIALLVIAIALTFKGPDVAKRVIRKV